MARTIQAIDKEIDAVRKTLMKRRPVKDSLSPADWQAAWDAEPELASQSKALWCERGHAQAERAQREHEAAMRRPAPKAPKTKKCPACGRRAA